MVEKNINRKWKIQLERKRKKNGWKKKSQKTNWIENTA